MKMKCLWALSLIASSAGALAATYSPHVNTTPPPYAASNGGFYPIYKPLPHYPRRPRARSEQGCTMLVFTVDADGKPRGIKVWSHYPSDSFDQASVNALAKWRFHPRMQNGGSVVTQDVFQEFIFIPPLAGEENGFLPSAEAKVRGIATHIKVNNKWNAAMAQDTLSWFCEQPPMHGVAIVTRNVQPPTSATSTGSSQYGPHSTVYLTPPFPRAMPGRVKIRFCIDPDGRVRDTVVRDSSPEGVYDDTARQALEQVAFSARKLDGKPVWTCGLMVPVSFSGASSGKLGEIGQLSYRSLSGRPPEPILKEEKPVKLSLSIPPGTKLPPVAKVELRFCIEKDGSVNDITIIHADPPRLFNQAALETVENWRFERPPAKICDVYQGVQFPLGNH